MIPNPWLILVAVLAFAGAGVGGYAKGRHDADQTALVKSLAKELANAKAQSDEWLRQATALQHQAQLAADRQRAAEADAANTRTLVDDFAAKFAGRAPGACALSDDDARRLRDIAGPDAGAGETGASDAAGGLRPAGSAPAH